MAASISNNEIKRIRSLASKKFRDSLGLFAVEGDKMVSEALHSGFQVEKVYRREDIGEEAMSKITMLSTPSPALAIVRKPSDIDIAPSHYPCGLYLGLDSIRDPGNLGTIMRVADWFGIDAVFASHDTVDIFNPKTVQATMGAIFRVKFHYADLREVASGMTAAGGSVYGTFLDGNDIYDSKLEDGSDSPVMIVIGNESDGISERISSVVTDRLFIPPFPADCRGSESLNAAVATAVTVAEFRRRNIVRRRSFASCTNP